MRKTDRPKEPQRTPCSRFVIGPDYPDDAQAICGVYSRFLLRGFVLLICALVVNSVSGCATLMGNANTVQPAEPFKLAKTPEELARINKLLEACVKPEPISEADNANESAFLAFYARQATEHKSCVKKHDGIVRVLLDAGLIDLSK